MVPSFSTFDAAIFAGGRGYSCYRKLGAHLRRLDGKSGTQFCLWAPNAKSVSVITAHTDWDEEKGAMELTNGGVWECFLPGVRAGEVYRFVVTGADGIKRYKSDPFAFASELRPANGSIVCPLKGYRWNDREARKQFAGKTALEKPMAIYEVHLGSWKKEYSENPDGFMNYRRLADELVEYLNFMGYTHVELIGICEYPFDGSWGYQVTGYFCPTARYGTPDDFRYFVDTMHTHGIGVILDWVPAHFPRDDFGLENFDGTPLYESADPLLAEYPEWGTKAFDHSKGEVRSFLSASAFYWRKEFHIDALRVDAVAAMLYTSFGRSQWRVNEYGGTENLESMEFLKKLNSAVLRQTDAFMIAEDSSILPGITENVENGGFGFLFKWNMGWMNDTLKYIEEDPLYRHWLHGKLTHTADYAFTENYVLVLSHDEVVHLKKPMVGKAPGGISEQLATLKSLYTFQFTHPGKKLLFMGQEFAEDREWDENRSLDWGLAENFGHRDVLQCVRNLIGIYKMYPSLYVDSKNPVTFEWVNSTDSDRNIISYIRRNPWNYDGAVLVVCSFSPLQHNGYRCGVPKAGLYKRMFSTYDSLPGSGGPGEQGDIPPLTALKEECDGREYCISYDLRPFESIIVELPQEKKTEKGKE